MRDYELIVNTSETITIDKIIEIVSKIDGGFDANEDVVKNDDGEYGIFVARECGPKIVNAFDELHMMFADLGY